MTVASVTDLPPAFHGIEAVCFDAFGTLVEIADPQQAFVPLFRALPTDKRRELKYRLMREAQAVSDWPMLLGAEVDPITMLDVSARVMAEVYSVAIRPGMADIWTRLRKQGLKLAVCSNLASPYGTVIRHTLPDYPDVEVLSYKVGAIKPEPAIYARVIDGLKVAPDKMLFVGDTVKADIEAPRAAGMRALHVDKLVRIMGRDSRS
jgi:HAD superfamily hydrolase (TIGR01509 family)